MLIMNIFHNGQWKTASAVYVFDSNQWKEASEVHVFDNSQWKEVSTGSTPTLSSWITDVEAITSTTSPTTNSYTSNTAYMYTNLTIVQGKAVTYQLRQIHALLSGTSGYNNSNQYNSTWSAGNGNYVESSGHKYPHLSISTTTIATFTQCWRWLTVSSIVTYINHCKTFL